MRSGAPLTSDSSLVDHELIPPVCSSRGCPRRDVTRCPRGLPRDRVMSTMPELAELLHDAVPFALPLHRAFRGMTVREGLLIRGPSGWGEFAPFEDYSPQRSAPWLAAAAEAAFGTWPQPVREVIAVNAIIPAVNADDAAALARSAVLDHGCTTVKVKVAAPGEKWAEDEARVASVRDAVDVAMRGTEQEGRVAIRLDANAGWSLDDAVRTLSRLVAYDLDYVEQPCADIEDLRRLREEVDVRVAVDESVRVDGVAMSELAGIADVVIVKVGPVGGVRAGVRLVDSWPGEVVVSGALDSAVGLAAGVALAAALPRQPGACGLGTGALLAEDVIAAPLVPVAGTLTVGRVSPDLDALMRARGRLDEEQARRWRERAVAAWHSGGAELIDEALAAGA
jgi:O-succinylbenzoate synthase